VAKGLKVFAIKTRTEQHWWVDKAWDNLHQAVNHFLLTTESLPQKDCSTKKILAKRTAAPKNLCEARD
jgi:steroid 5-alpha reductase family enzyme